MTDTTGTDQEPQELQYVRVDRPDGSRVYCGPYAEVSGAIANRRGWRERFPEHRAKIVGARASRVDRAKWDVAKSESADGKYHPAPTSDTST